MILLRVSSGFPSSFSMKYFYRWCSLIFFQSLPLMILILISGICCTIKEFFSPTAFSPIMDISSNDRSICASMGSWSISYSLMKRRNLSKFDFLNDVISYLRLASRLMNMLYIANQIYASVLHTL